MGQLLLKTIINVLHEHNDNKHKLCIEYRDIVFSKHSCVYINTAASK